MINLSGRKQRIGEMKSDWTKENYRYGLSFTSYLIIKTDIYNVLDLHEFTEIQKNKLAYFSTLYLNTA